MRKWIAFLLVFTLLAVGGTYVCIQKTLGEPLVPLKTELSHTEQLTEAGVDLHGTYDENHLLFSEVQETMGAADIAYPQIDGLKDGQVQAAVNEALRLAAQAEKNYYVLQEKEISYLTYQIYGNFSNILSVGFFSGDVDYDHRQTYLNFNLTNGSQLTLEDVFCTQADLQAIVHSAFYDALTQRNLQDYYGEQLSSPDEQELYRTVRGYLGAEHPAFSMSPDGVYLYYGDYMATVDMMEHAADIGVYTKHLTEESIFLRQDIGYRGVFTCVELPEGFADRQFGYGADNFWYDVALGEDYIDEEIPEAVREGVSAHRQKVYAQLLEEVESVRALAKGNPQRGYILLAQPDVHLYQDAVYENGAWQSTPSKAVVVNEYYTLYETSAELFHGKYMDSLVAEYRRNPYYLFHEGIDQYLDGDEVQTVKRQENRLFLYENGEEVTVESLFVAGYDYAAAIKAQAKYGLMSYYGYTMEGAEQAAQTVTYELAGSGLEVRLPGWDREQYIRIPLKDFPRAALTIF